MQNDAQAVGANQLLGDKTVSQLLARGEFGQTAGGRGEASKSSARFTGELPVASNGSNFDLRNITAARFNTDPSMTMFRHANMNLEQTRAMFGDLRKQGFRDPEIHRAAKDVSDLRIGGTPEKMRKNAEHASHLNKKAPEFVPAFKKIDKKEGETYVNAAIKAGKLQKELDAARARGDSAAATAKLEKDLEAARKQAKELQDKTLAKENEAINKHVKPAEQPRAKDWQKDTWERRRQNIRKGIDKVMDAGPSTHRDNNATGERQANIAATNQARDKNKQLIADAGKIAGGDLGAQRENKVAAIADRFAVPASSGVLSVPASTQATQAGQVPQGPAQPAPTAAGAAPQATPQGSPPAPQTTPQRTTAAPAPKGNTLVV